VAFRDAELNALVERALSQNLDLAQAEARLAQARAGAKAAGAALAPAGQLSAQGEYQEQSLSSPSARIQKAFPGFRRYQKLYDMDVGASWEPDLFGGLRRGAEAARARYQASAAAKAGVHLAVAAETANAYVQVRALQARLAVARADARTQADLSELVRAETAHGVASRLQLDQVMVARTAAEAAVASLEAGLEAEMTALEVLVGVDPGSLHAELASEREIPRPPAVESAGGPAALLRRRPDIMAAERNLAAADARIGAAIADYYPKVTLSGVLGYEASDIGQLVSPAAFQPQGVIGLRWRLFDFGRVDAEVAEARGSRAEALAAYRQAVLKATADVETALSSLARGEAQAASLEAGEASLSRVRAATEAAHGTGRLSRVEVLTALHGEFAARDQTLQARAAATRAAIAAFRALGGGWSA
jgi:NodT family efflux transporter outer membrane factor (OMF) lipoprotein